jgi:protein O-mannosyl-transferase
MARKRTKPKQKNVHPGETETSVVPDLNGTHPGESATLFENRDLVIAILLLSTAIVYFNTLSGQFVYDDWFQIERNPTLRSWSNLPLMLTQSVWQFMDTANTQAIGPYYRPVFNVSLLLNYQLFGFNVAGWHLFSIALHFGASLLLYSLAKKWGFEPAVSAAAALIFAVHPIHSEAVAWASSTPDLLVAFFSILSLLLYERFREKGVTGWPWIIGALASALLAMGSKEIGVLIPVFIALRELLEIWFKSAKALSLRTIFFFSAPFVVVAAGYLAARFSILGFVSQTHPLARDVTNWEMFLTIPYIFLQYLRISIVPYPLAFVYSYTFISEISDIRFWGALLAIGAILGLLIWLIRSSPLALKAALLFGLFIVPVLDLKTFSPQESLVHDRYLYLPSAGICLLFAMGVSRTARYLFRESWASMVFATAVAAVSIIYGTLTVLQNRTWQNDLVLSRHALNYSPDWPFLNIHIGEVYAERGEFDNAVKYLQRAIDNQPTSSAGFASLGYVYSMQGRFEDAEAMFQRAVQLGSPFPRTWINIGINRTKLGRLPEAEEAFANALRLNSKNLIANFQLGIVLRDQGKSDAAEAAFLRTLELEDRFIDARLNLAAVYAGNGRMEDALEQVRIARRIDPENNEILLTEGGIYLRSNECSLAASTLSKLVSRVPDHPRGFLLLGMAHECLKNNQEAIGAYERAIAIAPNEQFAEVARRNIEKLKKGQP